MGSGGRKNVATVEGRGQGGADHPGGIGDFTGGFEAIAVLDEGDEAVVGKNEILTALGLHDDGFSSAADGGIDDHHEDGSRRKVRSRAVKEAGTVENGERRDL